ncbi:MAG: NAD(P)/FAD-dependent oxidoreductase [Acidobacteriota bacterium]
MPSTPSNPQDPYDALIVGGGPAGLSAALYLGRARKRVAVLDRGHPRHAVSQGVHNFLTRDGLPPAELRTVAWEQMAAYPSVDHRSASVKSLSRSDDRWEARLGDGAKVTARAALVATGVVDQHPEIPGFKERWGHSIHHCPFCHGWEMRDRPLALLGSNEAVGHMAPLLRNWSSDVVVLTHGGALPEEIAATLDALGIPVATPRVERLSGPGSSLRTILLADGTPLEREGLFVIADQRQCDLVTDLDLQLDEGGYVVVDGRGATDRPMLWAAGDLTTPAQQVVDAAAQGARAGATMVAALTVGH